MCFLRENDRVQIYGGSKNYMVNQNENRQKNSIFVCNIFINLLPRLFVVNQIELQKKIRTIIILIPFNTFLFGLGFLFAQETDSSQVAKYKHLQAKLDSMSQEIYKLRTEISAFNVTTSDSFMLMDGLLNDVGPDSTEKIGDQRSRRKRLDALLEEYMKRPGVINFNGDVTGILQGSFSDQEDISTATGSFDLFVATRLGRETLVFVDLEAIGGNGPNENITSLVPLNGDAGSTQTPDGLDRMHVLEAWVEFSALGDLANFTAGKIDLTNYFDNNAAANDETAQFISSAFVNSAAFPAPFNTPGIKLRAEFPIGIFFQLAAVSSDNSGNRIFERLFKIASSGFRIDFGKSLVSTFRFYGYIHGDADNSKGYGISVDLPIGSKVEAFGRWNKNEHVLADYAGIESAWSGGLQFNSRLLNRPLLIGAAFGETRSADTRLRKERIVEVFFRQHVNQWVHLSPHFQLLENAAGSSERTVLLGFRSQFDF